MGKVGHGRGPGLWCHLAKSTAMNMAPDIQSLTFSSAHGWCSGMTWSLPPLRFHQGEELRSVASSSCTRRAATDAAGGMKGYQVRHSASLAD